MVNDDVTDLTDEENEESDRLAKLHAEAEARAQAFQAWWSSPDGEVYRNLHRQVNKEAAQAAFRAGWTAAVDALARLDDDGPYSDPLARLCDDIDPDDLGDA